MKKLFAFVLRFKYVTVALLIVPVALIGQDSIPDSVAVGAGGVVNELIALFVNKYNLIIGVAFFLANLGVQNIKWLADRFDAKLLSSLVATLAAIIAVIIEKGSSILDNVIIAVGLVWFLYNLIKGSIDSKKGETESVKNTAVVKEAIIEATIAAGKQPGK